MNTQIVSHITYHPKKQMLAAFAGLLALVVILLGNVLFAGNGQVLGNHYTDLYHQLIGWRQFGFDHLRNGQIALWNPHIYAGAPFVGGFQSALFYPLNWIFLILPMDMAINWSIALHVFMMGAFFFIWMVRRGVSPIAGFVGAAAVMLSGPYYLHIYAGHLPNLCTMVWAPLIFLSVDEIIGACSSQSVENNRAFRWVLIGGLVTALQILAGHPQYVFYTAVGAVIYAGLSVAMNSRPMLSLAYLSLVPILAVCLSAVQLLPSLQAGSEIVRSKSLSYAFASMFSFPPENLLTWLAPFFWGNLEVTQYFGRGYLWEMCSYMGVITLIMAGFAGTQFRWVPRTREERNVCTAVVMVVLMTLLALGAHTPMFQFLYNYVPGFDRFRGMSKFIFLGVLFCAALAVMGLDRLISTDLSGKRATQWLLAIAIIIFLASIMVRGVDWSSVILALANTHESYLWENLFQGNMSTQISLLVLAAGNSAANSLAIVGVTFLVISGVLYAARKTPQIVWAIPILAVLELMVFAATTQQHFPIDDGFVGQLRQYMADNPGDYRIANTSNPNDAMRINAFDVSGNDPGVVGRYAELLTHMLGSDADQADQYLGIRPENPLNAVLRLTRVLQRNGSTGQMQWEILDKPMGHLHLVGEYQLAQGRDAVFAAMDTEGFDPRKTVILETMPVPLPQANPFGEVHLIDSTTDSLTIEATTDRPAILMITDVYTPSWRVRALEDSVQRDYQLLPADYALRAVPLRKGKHRFVVEYNRGYLHVGIAITVLSLFLCVLAWMGGTVVSRQKARNAEAQRGLEESEIRVD